MSTPAGRRRDHGNPQLGAAPLSGTSLEDWRRIVLKRERCIALIRRSDDYVAAAQRPGRPATPDPRQPGVGSRAWDRSTRQFREDLCAFVRGRDDDPAQGRPARSRPPLGGQLASQGSEAEWARRHRKRCTGVDAVKRSADYIAAVADPGANRPATPDPWDRTLNKRAWEHGMQSWRADLAAVAANGALEELRELAERVAELALD